MNPEYLLERNQSTKLYYQINIIIHADKNIFYSTKNNVNILLSHKSSTAFLHIIKFVNNRSVSKFSAILLSI